MAPPAGVSPAGRRLAGAPGPGRHDRPAAGFLAPFLILYLLFVIGPALYGLVMSRFDTSLVRSGLGPFVGLAKAQEDRHEGGGQAAEADRARHSRGQGEQHTDPVHRLRHGAEVHREAVVGGCLPGVGVGGEEAWLAADLAAAGWRLAYVPQIVARHRPSVQRDRHGRVRRDLRNALWFTWTRRRGGRARRSVSLVRQAGASSDTVAGFAQALRGAEWVRQHRRPRPWAVEADLALPERAADDVDVRGG